MFPFAVISLYYHPARSGPPQAQRFCFYVPFEACTALQTLSYVVRACLVLEYVHLHQSYSQSLTYDQFMLMVLIYDTCNVFLSSQSLTYRICHSHLVLSHIFFCCLISFRFSGDWAWPCSLSFTSITNLNTLVCNQPCV